jgi:hypothetical protein
MAVYPNTATLKFIQDRQSSFGCGDYECLPCYPIQYACANCNSRLERPVFVTRPARHVLCPDCHWEGEVLVK